MWIPPGESSMDAVKTAGCFFGKRKAEVKDRRVFWWITFLEPNNLNTLQSRFLQNLTRDCLEWPDNINLKTYVNKNENTEVARTAHLHILVSKNPFVLSPIQGLAIFHFPLRCQARFLRQPGVWFLGPSTAESIGIYEASEAKNGRKAVALRLPGREPLQIHGKHFWKLEMEKWEIRSLTTLTG